MNPRLNAVRALEHVLRHNRTIDWVLANTPDLLDSPLAQELTYGVLRHYFALATVIDQQLRQPLRAKDRDVYCLLLVGAYQLFYTRVPDHAAINETVAAAARSKKPWAKGMVNAVLRNINPPDQSFGSEYPDWLANRLGELAGYMLERAPMTVRINPTRGTCASYRAALGADGIDFAATPLDEAVVLNEPQPQTTLPGWSDGLCAVQDLAAMYAAHIAVAHYEGATRSGGMRMLDACCAPGGKLSHLIELCADHGIATTGISGLDSSDTRLQRCRDICGRLGHVPDLKLGDAAADAWWDRTPFDHILLDAPCSGSGTLRRNPDIKVLLQEAHLAKHQALQLELLRNLWRMVAPGGSLLYCTCSIFQEENDDVISQFLADSNTASDPVHVVNLTLPSGAATQYGWQLTPTDPQTDGFYYALLTRSPAAAVEVGKEAN